MSKYIGADWASQGWFAIILNDQSFEWAYYPTITDLWSAHTDADRICIDLPIGLPQHRCRACDYEAKRLLGTRGNSVFYTPTRKAVHSANLSRAKEIHDDLDFGIQSQAWSLIPRIRELDSFLQRPSDRADTQIWESHPEVAFAALNEGAPLDFPKDTRKGTHERLRLLAGLLETPVEHFQNMIACYESPKYAMQFVKRDDILDTMAVATVAKFADSSPPTLPQASDSRTDPQLERDMQIAYYPDVDWNLLHRL